MQTKLEKIIVRGARTHNLNNISVDIPRNKLVVITGLSGSGKSSLAFDTLYAEGQRRYVESLSAYARQFLNLMEKPDVELIEGLSPAIAIDQKVTSHNPRSTIGTVTEIYDYLRLLFARAGVPHCPDHPEFSLEAQSISQMVDTVLEMPESTRLMIIAPVVTGKKGEYTDLFEKLQAKGFIRFRVQSGTQKPEVYTFEDLPTLKKTEKHTIGVIVDRIRVSTNIKQRLSESLETALNLAEGRAIVCNMDTNEEQIFSNKFACPVCGFSLQELEPRLFSFNSPIGACSKCDGLGITDFFDPNRIVSNPTKTIREGAIACWDCSKYETEMVLESLGKAYDFDLDTPYKDLSDEAKHVLMYGSGKQKITFSATGFLEAYSCTFGGAIKHYETEYRRTTNPYRREEISKYRNTHHCPDCGGARLCRPARFVTIGNGKQEKGIQDVTRMPLSETLNYFQTLKLAGKRGEIAERIIHEIVSRTVFLNNVGLGYLSLDRGANTLSGGESQRIRLASQIGSALTGVMYVLDEPSIGLHQRDNTRLIQTLQHLRDLGNSIIVVEHDEETIRTADYIVDMGVGAGVHGGNVVVSGSVDQVISSKESLTGQYLRREKTIDVPAKRTPVDKNSMLIIEGANTHNLKDVTLRIPVGLMTCVTGVSGSGKSTLINDTLLPAVSNRLYHPHAKATNFTNITGLENFDKVISVDQSPIGRTPRSNPATYTGLFTPIRELFASVPQAKERGYNAGRFSFNVRGGRCESCQGDGLIKVEMHFLPDIYVACDVCGGKRYNRETLEVTYRGKNISDVLNMTIEEASQFFDAVPAIKRRLKTLIDVGLGYIQLGQSATTLSGGEAQRVKLSLELSKRDTGRTLYILDEPTTGLHFHDVNLLLKVLHRLRDQKNTVIIIEHNLDVIKTADWIVDLGPDGGAAGGQIIAEGTPEDVAKNPISITGKYLGQALKQR